MVAREPGGVGESMFLPGVCVSRAQSVAQYMAQLIISEFIKRNTWPSPPRLQTHLIHTFRKLI